MSEPVRPPDPLRDKNHEASRPGFRDPANAKSKALKKGKKDKKR